MIYLFVSLCDIRKPSEKYAKQEPQRTCCSLTCASFSSRVLISRSSLCRSCSQRTRSCSSLFFSSISSFCQNWSLSVAFISCSGITLQSPPFDQKQSVKIVIYINVPFFLKYTHLRYVVPIGPACPSLSPRGSLNLYAEAVARASFSIITSTSTSSSERAVIVICAPFNNRSTSLI